MHHRGFLIIQGLLSREVHVLGRECVELLGRGDVLRPWRWDPDGSHVHAEVGWMVLEPTQLAVLDHGLVTRMNPWPQLGVELFARGTRRAHSLAVALAIAHHQRVDDRLLLTLWHLAERWGRVGTEGIAVPLPLSHQRLADLIGAHRPAVTTAMGELTRRGAISRRLARRTSRSRSALPGHALRARGCGGRCGSRAQNARLRWPLKNRTIATIARMNSSG